MFDAILRKLGFGERKPPPSAPAASGKLPPDVLATDLHKHDAPSPAAEPTRPAARPAVVDVTGQLERLAAANPQKLNWKSSIVDLLKLLGIDHSYAARKELATELGCPPDKMGDSAQMNMWLHKEVIRKLAENGGKVPQELL